MKKAPFYALSKRHCFLLMLTFYIFYRSYIALPPLSLTLPLLTFTPPAPTFHEPGVDTLILRVRALPYSSLHPFGPRPAATGGSLSAGGSPAAADGAAAALPPAPAPRSPLFAAAPSPASPLLPVSALLPLAHPLFPYPPTREYSASLRSGWFTGDMPYFNGPHTCPASGCRVSLTGRGGDAAGVDMMLYHMGPRDYTGGGEGVEVPGRGGAHLVALMTAEGFDLASRPAGLFASFNAEHSFRPSSLVRDTYVLWFLNDAHKQGISRPQRPLRMDAVAWGDIWEPPLPLAQRSPTAHASWGSHYCRGSRSGREDLVRALMAAGLRVAVFGEGSQCLRNVEEPLASADRNTQFAAMRTHKFYLAFENHRLEGYVSEKFYWALLRGQVPVVWGAPDIERYSPGVGSYIDAAAFPSAEALAQHLLALDTDDEAYMSYHSWRTERSFWDYGDVLREELLEMIWVGNKTMHPPDWYNCRFCHAFERFAARGGFKTPPPLGIKTFSASERPAFK